MKIWYMAHPVATDGRYTIEQNLQHVLDYLRFFIENGVYVIAPYHTMCSVVPDDPKYRKMGLELDVEVAKRIGRIILVGHKFSSGMIVELDAVLSLPIHEAHSYVEWNREDILPLLSELR